MRMPWIETDQQAFDRLMKFHDAYFETKKTIESFKEKPEKDALDDYLVIKFLEKSAFVEYHPFSQKNILECNLMDYYCCDVDLHKEDLADNPISLSAYQSICKLDEANLYVNLHEFKLFKIDKMCKFCNKIIFEISLPETVKE